jgi:hypothetical protein
MIGGGLELQQQNQTLGEAFVSCSRLRDGRERRQTPRPTPGASPCCRRRGRWPRRRRNGYASGNRMSQRRSHSGTGWRGENLCGSFAAHYMTER